MSELICPDCFHQETDIFYGVEETPVNSMIHVPTREEALSFPRGDVRLGCCGECGFIFNTAFDHRLAEYSERYESTQRHSETFSRFNEALAEKLIDKHGLIKKKIIEIGCGEGEFLYQLCRSGSNSGVGFDPAYRGTCADQGKDADVSFICDYFSEKYGRYRADFYVCKMTLEHIQDVSRFLSMIGRTVTGSRPTLFFQVPNFGKSLHEGAFWDVYYEHCSYFTSGSLAGCFERNGFTVTDRWTSFQDQYLMLEAVPSFPSRLEGARSSDPVDGSGIISAFQSATEGLLEEWSRTLRSGKRSGNETVIWGASSRGVSFLTTLETMDVVKYAVDINPNKRGMFIPGSGQKIVGPQDMRDIKPDTVIVMNPVYIEEIRVILRDMDLSPLILSVDQPFR